MVFSVNKTDRHDITEILLKVTLHTITPTLVSYIWQNGAWFSHGKPVSSINKAYLFARWRIWFYNESTIEMHELVRVSGNLNTWVWNRVVNPCSWWYQMSSTLTTWVPRLLTSTFCNWTYLYLLIYFYILHLEGRCFISVNINYKILDLKLYKTI